MGEPAEDSELLRRYADTGSEAAFAELVRRRIGLVYSVALRQTRGDTHRAEDATQAVFTDLARKAATLSQRPVLAGWLYRSAQFAAAGLIRAEQRRHAREHEAHLMEEIFARDSPEPDWEKLRPVLDQALNEMDERDRDAILLRFFDERPFAEIGARLRLTEGAARMRVERALDKLNAALARRGITSSATALGVALAHQVGAATPAGLAATVTGTALAGTAATAGGWLAAFMGMTKIQIGIASAVAVAGVTGYVSQAETNAELRRAIAAAQQTQQAVATLRSENQRLASVAAEVELLRRDDIELKQLAQGVAEARKAQTENARLSRIRESRQSQQQNAQAEVQRLNREGQALVDDYKALVAQSKDASLTPEARAQADAAAKQKLAAIQAKQREVQAFIANVRETQPNFQASSAQPGRPASGQSMPGAISFKSADSDRVSLRFPQVDSHTAFSAFELYSGRKIISDPSIAGVRGTLDLQTGVITKGEAMQALQAALRDQLNIILEPTGDGNFVAKLGPAR